MYEMLYGQGNASQGTNLTNARDINMTFVLYINKKNTMPDQLLLVNVEVDLEAKLEMLNPQQEIKIIYFKTLQKGKCTVNGLIYLISIELLKYT